MTDATRPLRRMLAAVLFVGMVGVGAELVLMEHDEEWKQLVPLAALGAGIAAQGWDTYARRPASRWTLRVTMLALAASGVAGLWLHYESNVEFQRELDPSLAGWSLVLATMRAHSPPSLGPGVLCLLGAIGWIATHDRNDF